MQQRTRSAAVRVLVVGTAVALVVLGTVRPAPALAAPSLVVRAQLVTTSGAPLVLREVSMTSTASSPGEYTGTRITNGNGTAIFPRVPRGSFVLRAVVPSASGAVTVRRTVSVGSVDRSVTLAAAVDTTLYGLVRRGSHGVDDARVSARRVGATHWSPTTGTAGNGAWNITDRSPGSYVVKAEGWSSGYLTTYSGDTVREPDAQAVPVAQDGARRVVVRTVGAASLVGKVRGPGAVGASVHADNLGRFGTADAFVGADGRFRLDGLATGRVRVTVLDEHFRVLARTVVDAVQGATRTVGTLRVSRAAAGTTSPAAGPWGTRPAVRAAVDTQVTGVVRHAGVGVVGAQVVVGTAQGAPVTGRVVTGPDGRFVVVGVPAGTWRVYVRDPYTGGYLDASRQVVVGDEDVEVPAIVVRVSPPPAARVP